MRNNEAKAMLFCLVTMMTSLIVLCERAHSEQSPGEMQRRGADGWERRVVLSNSWIYPHISLMSDEPGELEFLIFTPGEIRLVCSYDAGESWGQQTVVTSEWSEYIVDATGAEDSSGRRMVVYRTWNGETNSITVAEKSGENWFYKVIRTVDGRFYQGELSLAFDQEDRFFLVFSEYSKLWFMKENSSGNWEYISSGSVEGYDPRIVFKSNGDPGAVFNGYDRYDDPILNSVFITPWGEQKWPVDDGHAGSIRIDYNSDDRLWAFYTLNGLLKKAGFFIAVWYDYELGSGVEDKGLAVRFDPDDNFYLMVRKQTGDMRSWFFMWIDEGFWRMKNLAPFASCGGAMALIGEETPFMVVKAGESIMSYKKTRQGFEEKFIEGEMIISAPDMTFYYDEFNHPKGSCTVSGPNFGTEKSFGARRCEPGIDSHDFSQFFIDDAGTARSQEYPCIYRLEDNFTELTVIHDEMPLEEKIRLDADFRMQPAVCWTGVYESEEVEFFYKFSNDGEFQNARYFQPALPVIDDFDFCLDLKDNALIAYLGAEEEQTDFHLLLEKAGKEEGEPLFTSPSEQKVKQFFLHTEGNGSPFLTYNYSYASDPSICKAVALRHTEGEWTESRLPDAENLDLLDVTLDRSGARGLLMTYVTPRSGRVTGRLAIEKNEFWKLLDVSFIDENISCASLDFDMNNRPYMVYYDEPAGELNAALFLNDEWRHELISNEVKVEDVFVKFDHRENPGVMAFESFGQPRILYFYNSDYSNETGEAFFHLNLNQTIFEPGDDFILRGTFHNADETRKVVIFLLLDMYDGNYWSWPSWSRYPPDIDRLVAELPPNFNFSMPLLDFLWPGSYAEGYISARFTGLMLDDTTGDVLGEIQYKMFYW